MRALFAAPWAWAVLWTLGASLAALVLMGFDKGRAKRGGRRVRERTLWLAALLGGGPGAFCGMKLFRHKTQHTAFCVGLPLLALAQAGLLLWAAWAKQ